MTASTKSVPSLPELGRPERFYIEHVHEADRFRDPHAHEAYKVGLYITRAINYCNTWKEKLRCFQHAIKHHCHAPLMAPPEIVEFYLRLAHMVREQAGQEAQRVASKEDDKWAARIAAGEPRSAIVRDAEHFFYELFHSNHKPDWINLEDYDTLKILKAYWS